MLTSSAGSNPFSILQNPIARKRHTDENNFNNEGIVWGFFFLQYAGRPEKLEEPSRMMGKNRKTFAVFQSCLGERKKSIVHFHCIIFCLVIPEILEHVISWSFSFNLYAFLKWKLLVCVAFVYSTLQEIIMLITQGKVSHLFLSPFLGCVLDFLSCLCSFTMHMVSIDCEVLKTVND